MGFLNQTRSERIFPAERKWRLAAAEGEPPRGLVPKQGLKLRQAAGKEPEGQLRVCGRGLSPVMWQPWLEPPWGNPLVGDAGSLGADGEDKTHMNNTRVYPNRFPEEE